jgi:hypothetical protein
VNIYAYAGNDPVNRIDPTGLVAGVDDVAVIGGAAILLTGAAIYGILANNPDAVNDMVKAIEDGLSKAKDKVEDICEPKGPPPNEICPKIAESHFECVYDCPISGLISTLRWGASEGPYPPDNDICPPSIVVH